MANAITALRIVLSPLLAVFPPYSLWFYVFYVLLGLSDVLDGAVARRRGEVSAVGARLDTIADFVFFASWLIALLIYEKPPVWLYVWIGAIALVKLINAVSGVVVQKKFVALHTVLNKLTGAALFLVPFAAPFVPLQTAAIPVCALATVAAVQEGHLIRTGVTEP